MAAVRALPAAAPAASPTAGVDGEHELSDSDEVDLDAQIAALSAAHDMLRQQLASIER